MKKLIICIALLLSSIGVWAQKAPKVNVEWGVLAGINISDFSIKDSNIEVRDKLGFQAGISIALNFGSFALEPQLLFVRNTMDVLIPSTETFNLKSNTLQVPVLFSIRMLKPLRFNVGPVFNVMNNCRYKMGDDLIDFGRTMPTVSYTIGVGVTVVNHFLIDLRYNGQFTSVKNVFSGNGFEADMRSYSIGFSIGYIF